MSRHRNVRSMNYEEYYDEDDDYSQSVEDNYCISPGTVAQFTFNRDKDVHHLASYMGDDIPEEGEESDASHLNDSARNIRKTLSDVDQGKLNSCLDEIRNILGDTSTEQVMSECVLKHNFNTEKALNELLSQAEAPKPQRQPRENRRNRSQEASASGIIKPTVILKNPPNANVTKQIDGNVSQIKNLTVIPKKEPIVGFNPVVSDSKDSLVPDNSSVSLTSKSSESLNGATDSVSGDSLVSNSNALLTPKRVASDYRPPLPKSSSKSKPKFNVMDEYKKRKGEKELINMVVIGHVDAGKSTLMGHLLFQLGFVNKRTMHKYEQESKKVGKGSFVYAWVLDETEEERSRGVTMDVAQTRFETPKKIVTLLDAPGHKDFIPNMITGAAQADVAVLVINATRGEFETGFDTGGQTREHALLSRSLGVSQIIVAVNKMDTVDWSQERYKHIINTIGQFLKQAGFRDKDVSFIPCSGLVGINLAKTIDEPKLSSWYDGPTLISQIDQFKCLDRPIDKPFRLNVADIFKSVSGGFTVSGRVCAGHVQAGDRVLVLPHGSLANVKFVLIDEGPTNVAFAGDHVTLSLIGVEMAHVNIGSMLCDPLTPSKCATKISAKIVIFNLEVPITRGYPVVFHYQSINEPAIIKKLVSHLNKSTGEVIKNKPKCIGKNTSAVVEIEFERSTCVELYKEFKDLGRFMLRNNGHTIAAGVVEEILQSKAKSDE
ncbi:HBS1-like protein [Patella vulgata]|uniref:HBS1-like protein n=1 Tax=Patella vulgata TaxID=6465 RepID=UPI00217F4B0C|nr:HBS1-like protein [Patella vulgata]